MKKWLMIFLALTLSTAYSIGYAETEEDGLIAKSSSICVVVKDSDAIQKPEAGQEAGAKIGIRTAQFGNIFAVDRTLEKVQKYGY